MISMYSGIRVFVLMAFETYYYCSFSGCYSVDFFPIFCPFYECLVGRCRTFGVKKRMLVCNANSEETNCEYDDDNYAKKRREGKENWGERKNREREITLKTNNA